MTATDVRGDLDDLATDLQGEVLPPGTPGYEASRTLFNAMIDRRPSAIVRCASPDDVQRALRFALDHDLEVAVRSGGHGVAGTALVDGGLVIDTRGMDEVVVDPAARTATVGGGATWGAVDAACQPHGLMTTGGRVTTTGVAGLTLGGGDGWLARRFGLACDHLLSVDLVTADGRHLTASEGEHPELFWALHGGGGNFGVATSLTFRLDPLPVTTFGFLVFDPDDGEAWVRAYRDLLEGDAPDELGGGLLYFTGVEEPFVPDHLVDRLAGAVVLVYAGPEDEARRAIEPLLDLGPAGLLLTEMPYAEIQSALDDPPGYRNYWSSQHLPAFPDIAVSRFCDRAMDLLVPTPSQQALLPWGGRIRTSVDDWPIAGREATWCVHPFGLWDDPRDDQRGIGWAKALRQDMEEFALAGTYLNFTPDEGRDRTIAGYGGEERYERLASVKTAYDPDNVFHHNHNIRPQLQPEAE